jgi:diguanylate cyclase (GGDEF)-like protein
MNDLLSLFSQFGAEAFLQHTHALVALIGSGGNLAEVNPALEKIIPLLPEDGAFVNLLANESRREFARLLRQALTEKAPAQGRLLLLVDLNTPPRPFNCLFVPLPDKQILFFAEYPNSIELAEQEGLAEALEKSTRDLEQTKKALDRKQRELQAVLAQVDEVAHTDPLTYLSNRRQIIGDLQREVYRAETYQTLLSVSMLDIDHFKDVNDTYGHTVGDEVLVKLSDLLRENVRHPDFVGRYGGEEFLLILPGTNINSASTQAERLCEQVRQTVMNVKNQEIKITVSIGIAHYRVGVDTWQKLLNRADKALYQAKQGGRDRWAVSEF